MPLRLVKVAVIALCVVNSGCVASKLPNNVVTVTQRTLGLDVSQDQTTGFYHLRLGFLTTQFHSVPTSNAPIYAPDVYSSISVGQKLFSTQIDEDYATGSNGVARIDNTNFESPAKLGAKRPK